MVRTSPVGLEEVADWENLCRALARASAGKRHRPEVARFVAHWPGELERLPVEILGGRLRLSPLRGFWIRDPKRRWIEAPSFRDRVLHHALVAQIEPVIERRLVDDTFACRRGKGCLKAVLRAQHHLRSNAWCAQVDVVGYYRSIEHARLLGQLGRVFRDPGLLALLEQILVSYAPRRARGLPIGALTSQILGNFYLAPLDRFILQDLRVGGFVRYMDDLTWFVKSRSQASDSSRAVAEFARESLNLELHRHRIQRADRGITLLGFRVVA